MEQAQEARAQFVQKLMEQPALREEFQRSPQATAEAHGVGPKAVEALQSVDWKDEELVTRLTKTQAMGGCAGCECR